MDSPRQYVGQVLSQLCSLIFLHATRIWRPHRPHQSLGPCLAVGPASPCAWNVCVSRNASLVASDSDEDKQKVAVTSEAVSMGPGRETPPLPTSVPRCTGVPSTALAWEQADTAAP